MKALCLDFDDLHWTEPENCLESIEYLVSKVPDIKLSFFTVAKLRGEPLTDDREWCDRIRGFIESNNVRLGVHGLTHDFLEFKHLDAKDAMYRIREAETIFDAAELPFELVFKSPNWGINEEVFKALSVLGYKRVFNHDDYRHLNTSGIEAIYYNWNLKDAAPDIEGTIYSHGHTHATCSNGIDEVRDKIVEFCVKEKPIFKFLNE